MLDEFGPAQHKLVKCTNLRQFFVIDLTFSWPAFFGCHWIDTQDPIIVLL